MLRFGTRSKEKVTTRITATFEVTSEGEPLDTDMFNLLQDALHHYKETGKYKQDEYSTFNLYTEEM